MHILSSSIKRSISLFLMLLVAFITQATTFTVNTTNQDETGKTGYTGSFADALKKIREGESKKWTIKFTCSGEININWLNDFTDLDELYLVGNGNVTLNLNHNTYKFTNIGSFSMEGVNIANVADASLTNKSLEIDGPIKYLKNCNFANTSIMLTSSCGQITECQFIESRIYGKSGKNKDIVIKSIIGCDFQVNPFYSAVWGIYFNSIKDCTFAGEGYCISYCIGDKIDNCTFTNVCGLNSTDCDSIKNSSFITNDTYWIYSGNIGSTEYSDNTINVITKCTFKGESSLGIKVTEGSMVKEISDCHFKNKSYCIAIENTNAEKILITRDTFEITSDNPCIAKDVRGLYTQNIFSPLFLSEIDPIQSYKTAPTIKRVLYSDGIYTVEGKGTDKSKIELYLSEGFESSAIQYLTSIDLTDADNLDFKVEIPAKDLKYGFQCFIATATYDDIYTSDLSQPVFAENKLSVTGEVTDNTCTTPNSRVVIKVSGWTDDCRAGRLREYNGMTGSETLKPTNVENGVATFLLENYKGGNYTFWASNKVTEEEVEFPFVLTTLDTNFLSSLNVTTSTKQSKCYGKNSGRISVNYDGNIEGLELQFTAKKWPNSTTYTSNKVNKAKGSVIFGDVATGEYDIYVNIATEGCSSTPVKVAEDKVTEVAKMVMDIEKITLNKGTCKSPEQGSFVLPIYNFVKGNKVIVYHEGHGQWSCQYPETENSTKTEQLYYKGSNPADGVYSTVYLKYENKSVGHYMIVAIDQCDNKDTVEFDLLPYEPLDLSNIKIDVTGYLQECADPDSKGKVRLDYTGVDKSQEVTLTLTGSKMTKSMTFSGSGNTIFHDMPVDEYEITIKDECSGEEKNFGKVAVSAIKKPSMVENGFAFDIVKIDGVDKKYFSLEIFNFKKGSTVTVYRDGEDIRSFYTLQELSKFSYSDKLRLYYTSEIHQEGGLYDLVILDWCDAIEGHYLVEVKDVCGNIYPYEFDVCKPIDLSDLVVKATPYRQQCAGVDNGKIHIKHSGISEDVAIYIKNDEFEQSKVVSGNGEFTFDNLPVGKYTVYAKDANCTYSSKTIGDVSVAKINKPLLDDYGYGDFVVDGKQQFSLMIYNYLDGNLVSLYRDGVLEAQFIKPILETSSTRSDNYRFFYMFDYPNNSGYFNWVTLDCGNAKSGKYTVVVEDLCSETYKYNFEIGDLTETPLVDSDDELVNVYNVLGVCLKQNVKRASALDGLKQGVYIVGNERVVKTANK